MNKKLSNLYLILFNINNVFAIVVIFSFWLGELNYYPYKIIMEILNINSFQEESKSIFPWLAKLLNWLISSMMYMLPFLLIGSGFEELSNRYKYNSWADMRKAKKKEYQKTFKDCGTVVDIDVDEGSFFTNQYVMIKTESKIFRCFGSVSEVKIGSKVRRQYDDLLVFDCGKEKRLRLT